MVDTTFKLSFRFPVEHGPIRMFKHSVLCYHLEEGQLLFIDGDINEGDECSPLTEVRSVCEYITPTGMRQEVTLRFGEDERPTSQQDVDAITAFLHAQGWDEETWDE